MNPQQRKTAEYALILAVGQQGMTRETSEPKEVRDAFKRIFTIMAVCQDAAKRLLTKPEQIEAVNVFLDWGEISGWRKEKHVFTFLSFALDIIEDSEFYYPDSVVDDLAFLARHYDNNQVSCCWAASLAVERWRSVSIGEVPRPGAR